MTIALAGKVIPYIEIQPSTQLYLTGVYGEAISKELVVSSNEQKKKFEITGLSSNIDDKITYSYAPDAEPGRYKVTVWKNPKLPTLNTWGSLYIDTNSEHTPQKVIQVQRGHARFDRVPADTGQFRSPEVQRQPADSSSPRSRRSRCSRWKGNSRSGTWSSPPPTTRRRSRLVEPGKRYKINVNFAPGAKKKNYQDEMIINTDDPQEPSVRVTILARGL